jgi:hypothetical protein
LSNVSANIAVAIFGVNMLVGLFFWKSSRLEGRKPKFYTELQQRKPKDKENEACYFALDERCSDVTWKYRTFGTALLKQLSFFSWETIERK